MATMEEVRRVKERREAELMQKAGVTGCAIGYKQVNGKKTDIAAGTYTGKIHMVVN